MVVQPDNPTAPERKRSIEQPTQTAPLPFPLFDLPRSVRDRIYRFALVEVIPIPLKHETRLPGIAMASRTLREETIDIYLLENVFVAKASAMQPRLPFRSSGHWIWGANFELRVLGPIIWANLTAWHRLYLANELPGYFGGDQRITQVREIVANSFAMVRDLSDRGLYYDEMETTLDALHGSVRVLNSNLLDHEDESGRGT